MARTRTIASIDAELSKLEAEYIKAQEKCEAIAARILDLRDQKLELESKQIMDAFKRSGKSMQELMNFLDI